MKIILSNGWVAPVPEGYTAERVIEILREADLEPVQIVQEDGSTTDLKTKAA